MKAVLGLGGNLGDAKANILQALDALDSLCSTKLLRVSSFYSTAAVEVLEPQPDYINCVAEIETELSPRALLGACLGIEAALGRVRYGYKAPRTVDIDLLICESFCSDDKELTLPHPRMLYRAFVLVPLSELYPDGNALGVDITDALPEVAEQQIAFHSRYNQKSENL